MALTQQAPVALDDYLEMEDASPLRHEYVGGQFHAMTGGSMRHNRIAGNIYAFLLQQLAGSPCQVFMHDMKLHVEAVDSVYYPDVFVHCGTAVAGDAKVVSDATLVVEVLSESTAGTDRREKRAAYQTLQGLRAYWIVSQDERRVQVHERNATGAWRFRSFFAGEDVPTAELTPQALSVAALYAGTDVT